MHDHINLHRAHICEFPTDDDCEEANKIAGGAVGCRIDSSILPARISCGCWDAYENETEN